jgi:hypothetical protein
MKKYYYFFFIICVCISKSFSQEITIKRRFFVPQPEYYIGEKYIGNSTRELSYFIKTNSQDSSLVKLLNESDRLSVVYPKIRMYSSIATGVGGIGLGYVIFKGTSDILKGNGDASLKTVAQGSLGIMAVGMAGLIVSSGYFISSQVKLRKAIKGYNAGIQKDKVTFDIQPYLFQDNAGLTVKLKF